MKTLELLNLSEASLTAEMKTMKLKELERHAEKILSTLGQKDYAGVLSVVIKAVPQLGKAGGARFAEMQEVIRKLLPKNSAGEQHHDVHTLERLAVIMMLIVSRKYNDILTGK